MTKNTLLSLLAFSFLLISCNKAETTTNGDIDSGLKAVIKAKNDSLLNALITSDSDALENLGSENFVKFMHAKINKVVWPFRKGYFTTNYKVFDEYHTIHDNPKGYSTIENDDHEYTFSYENNTKETYVSLLRCTHMADDYLITVIYGKEGNNWKIEDIEAGVLGINGKTPKELYAEAKEYKDKGFLLDAFFSIDNANDFLEPAGTCLKYNEEKRINFYSDQWLKEVQSAYKLPYILENIKTQPGVLEITVIKNAKGIYPLFKYGTQISVSDTLSLQDEFAEVKKEIKKTFNQVDYNKDFVYYRAYNLGENQEVTGEYTFEDKR